MQQPALTAHPRPARPVVSAVASPVASAARERRRRPDLHRRGGRVAFACGLLASAMAALPWTATAATAATTTTPAASAAQGGFQGAPPPPDAAPADPLAPAATPPVAPGHGTVDGPPAPGGKVRQPAPPPAPPTEAEAAGLLRDLAVLDQAATTRVKLPEPKATVKQALEALAAGSGVDVRAEWSALERHGVTPEDPSTFQTGLTDLLSALDGLCLSMGSASERPRVECRGGVLWITSDAGAAQMRRSCVYRSSDLPETFLAAITDQLDPDGWVTVGGDRQSFSRADGVLVMSAPPTVHRGVRRMMAEYRRINPEAVSVDAALVLVSSDLARERFAQVADDRAWTTLAASPGATSLGALRVVTRVGADGSAALQDATRNYRLTVTPSREAPAAGSGGPGAAPAGAGPGGGVLLTYSLEVGGKGGSATISGSAPVTPDGPPLALVTAIPDAGDRALVVLLRVRPAGTTDAEGP